MNKIVKAVIFLAVGISALSGCTKRIVPGISGIKNDPSYDSVSFDYIYVEGLKQKLLGNQGEALRLFEQCISINPKNDAVYFQVAQIALQSGDAENGKRFALKAIEYNERNIWYLTLMANIYYQEGNIDSAVVYYEKAVNYFPGVESIKINLGNLYAEKGNYKKAGEIYTYLEERYGESDEIGLFLIKNLVNSGDLQAAEEKVKEFIEKSPDELLYYGLLAEIYRKKGEREKAAEVYQTLIEKEPGNPQTLFSLIDFLRSEKEYEDIFSLLNTVIISDNIPREDKLTLFSDIVDDTDIVASKGKELEITLLVLESIYEGDDIVKLLRPELYITEGKSAEAAGRLNEMIKENPGNYYAWEKLLIIYSESGDYENLFTKGREAATRFNMSYLAKILYASAALEKNEYDVAREELRKAKILAGDQKEMLLQVMIMEADLYYREKDFMKSFETFDEALKMDSEDLIVLNNYAYYLAEQNENLKEAERMAAIVVEREKNNSTYLDTYAWVLYKRGKKKEAARIMEGIINSHKEGDADWFDHYGYIMKSLRKCDIAVEYWKRALEMDQTKTNLVKEIEDCSK